MGLAGATSFGFIICVTLVLMDVIFCLLKDFVEDFPSPKTFITGNFMFSKLRRLPYMWF